MAYTIIEVANTHGGDINYIKELILQFSKFSGNFGMKFQPLHPDKLATKDFEWYPVYQELLFDSSEWNDIISLAGNTKDVWLDIFDEYGVQILEENHSKIYGIKLQVSVLFNYAVLNALSKVDLSQKKLIINVASLDLNEIEYFLKKYEDNLNPEEILIEVGFQGYPTLLQDSGISKIKKIKDIFSKRIVFADHVDRESDYAVWLPVLAIASGADIIEKHVLLENAETKYDMYSSLGVSQFIKMVEGINNYEELLNADFINERECQYLEKSIMKPLLKEKKEKGEYLSIENDFEFKRSGKEGLNSKEIKGLISDFHIISTSKNKGDTLQKEDFKKASIAVIIACRLKSTRLKEKALLKIGDLTSVEFCIKNACKFDNVNNVVLATSNLDSDLPLKDFTYNQSVIFHQGDPEDVVQRYLDVTRKLQTDVVIRVTADCPFIDNEICKVLLKSHFESGADYTAAKNAAVGTNLEIINVQALEKVKSYFPSADLSEYMTWYFMNNEEYFKINLVDLPEDLVRDYRLTLDYDEDITLFNKIYENLGSASTFTLKDVFKLLDENPELEKINGHIKLKYKTDQSLIDTLNAKTKITTV
ncbi:N-acetylneuraminate synthase family protein [Flavobacterium sp. Fl-318]|uniref:N-acetylneuraminate synthase family protein n=1 Tax=Flavobacterium cupriresistens TaxID=2893885 RepID=A0ABU4RC25_9FLAO|nr:MULTISPECIES: N-acetylneuraminate synthase family protein [unclassified Flavobacterium]MDX6190127.1 N-acetylneuraminate synthase family protein [Flavobacterium sp. Fl-318]UFH42948.1 N-acetylneuraminate synthase family protein [Flavobacterium sp. F-323]